MPKKGGTSETIKSSETSDDRSKSSLPLIRPARKLGRRGRRIGIEGIRRILHGGNRKTCQLTAYKTHL